MTLPACPGFDERKHRIITDLANNTNDLSPKGSVDAPIVTLVDRINVTPHYYTTSSCSGRITLFQHDHCDGKGKSGRWLLCEHSAVTLPQLRQALHKASAAPSPSTAAILRFEPFILSVACRTLSAASLLLSAALQSGCRESGITSAHPNRPVMVSVRCSIRMELPVLNDVDGLGGLSEGYVAVLWQRLNGKMADNMARIVAFETWFETLCQAANGESSTKRDEVEERKEAESSEEDDEEAAERRWKLHAAGQEEKDQSADERLEDESSQQYNEPEPIAGHVSSDLLTSSHSPVPSHLSARHSRLHANITNLEARLERLLSTLSRSVTVSTAPLPSPSASSTDADDRSWCLLTPRQYARAVREACKALDWNETHRKVTSVPPHLVTTLLLLSSTPPPAQLSSEGWMALPLNEMGERECRRWVDGEGGTARLCEVLQLGLTPMLLHWTASPSLSPPPSPNQRLQQSLRTFLQQLQPPVSSVSSLLSTVPHRWEQLGDLVLLPSDALTSPAWSSVLSSLPPSTLAHFYSLLVSAFRCQRLARQQPVTAGLKRSSAVQLLVGLDGWVEHRENGVVYRFDVTHSMFASGNGSEKARLVELVRRAEGQYASEVVLDLYAGIGYFSLPLLVHTHVSHIHLCEHNSHTFDALTRSLAANNVPSSRYTLYPGDNRRPELQAAVEGKVDRVLLGLLPSSEDGWSTAVKALNADRGGWVHIHANVRVGREDEWARSVRSGLEALLQHEMGVKRGWVVRVAHVEHVKNFAPLVKHLVADVRLGPATERLLSEPPVHAVVGATARHVYRTDGIACYESPSTSLFWSTIFAAGRPALLRSLPLGDLSAFTPAALLSLPPASCPPVSVHICPEPSGRMDFVNKNYSYRTLDFHRFMLHVTGQPSVRDEYFISPHERYYLRSLGSDPRHEVADIRKSFPGLARSFIVPGLLEGRALFSSVLRVSSVGLSLWTHYDIVPNLLCHLHGIKRVTLFPPSASLALRLPSQPHSSSSPLLDLYSPATADDSWRQHGRQVLVRPGDVLFIPPLWFHHVETMAADGDSTAAAGVAVSVNVFWRALSDGVYTSGDVYGNKDVMGGVECMRRAEEAVKQLSELPSVYRDFYLDRAVSVLRAAKTSKEDEWGEEMARLEQNGAHFP